MLVLRRDFLYKVDLKLILLSRGDLVYFPGQLEPYTEKDFILGLKFYCMEAMEA